MLDENAKIEWTPPQYGKRMDDWLRNMGDWNISRRRYYGLPLPFYPCACGHLNVIGSRAELEARAVSGIEELRGAAPPVDRRGRHPLRALRRAGASASPRWATSGWTPASSRSRRSAGRTRECVPEGYATGAARGLTKADLPDHEYWEQWFPADWVTEMREQIRLWFYSLLFMSVVLTGRAPYRKVLTYEKLLDADGREMHGSWGNLISADEAFERMGADVMRWLYCQQPPTQNIRFGYGPGRRGQAPAAHAVELGALLHRLRGASRASSRATPTSTTGVAGRRAAAAGPLAAVARRTSSSPRPRRPTRRT